MLGLAKQAPPSAASQQLVLVVGVLSLNSTGRLARREAIRRLSTTSERALLIFALPAQQQDADVHRSDVLRVTLPAACDMRLNAKLFLQNGFLRWAVQHPARPQFIARADDDAVFNVSDVARYLADFGRLNPQLRYAIYGPFDEMYMWHRKSMQAVCIARSWDRWLGEGRAWRRAHAADGLSVSALHPANVSQCLRSGLSGPFPFAKGPFTAFSSAVVQLIISHEAMPSAGAVPRTMAAEARLGSPSLTRMEADERWLLGNRTREPLLNAFTGRIVDITVRSHPSRRTFFEEVYLASLVHELLQNESVALLHAWMSEYRGGNRRGADREPFVVGKTLFPAHIYHNLKKPSRFRALEEHRDVLLRRVHPTRPARCKPLVPAAARWLPSPEEDRWSPLSADAVRRAVCCRRWLRCLPR